MLALVTRFDLELEQMDVKIAFLYGELEETILIRQPKGFEIKGKEDQVCLLQRSLYGLKQSPMQWNKRFDQFMLKNNFCRSKYDNCIYYKEVLNDCMIYLLLYVDDIPITCKSLGEIQKLKLLLKGEFEMKDLGPTSKILGMEIKRDRTHGKLYLTQKSYLEKIISRFEMMKTKPVLTPFSSQFKLAKSDGAKTEEEKYYMSRIPYENVVGLVMYAMVYTRPDLSYAISVVSRYMGDPHKEH